MDGYRHAPTTLPQGMTRYPLHRRLGGPQGQSGWMQKISPPPVFNPWTIQPVVSQYTSWAIPTHWQQQMSPKFNASNFARTCFSISLSKTCCFQTILCFSHTCYISVFFISVFKISPCEITSLSTGTFHGSSANFPPPDRLVILRHFLHRRQNSYTAVTRSAHCTWQDYKTNKDILSELKIKPVVRKTQNYRRNCLENE